MRNWFCTGKTEKKGFAISIDALLATILVLSALAFIGMGTQMEEATIIAPAMNLKQASDDAFTALDNSGLLAKNLANTEIREDQVIDIYDAAKKLLPKNTDLKIEINEYKVADLGLCKTTYQQYQAGGTETTLDDVFTDCFGTNPMETYEYPAGRPPQCKEIAHGRKIAMMRQPVDSQITGSNLCFVCNDGYCSGDLHTKEKEEKETRLLLEGALGTDVETWADVVDMDGDSLTELSCGQQAKLIVRARNATREPIAMMLVMDESGSMAEYDMLQKQESKTFNSGTCEGTACVGTDETNCGNTAAEYTDSWQDVGSFTVDQALLDKMPYDNSRLQIFAIGSSNTAICNRTPKVKIIGPDEIEHSYAGGNLTNDYYYEFTKSTLISECVGYDPCTFTVKAWSDTPRTNDYYNRIYDYYYTAEPDDGTTNYPGGQGFSFGLGASKGVHSGSGSECVVEEADILTTNTGNWQLIKTFDLTDAQAGGLDASHVYGKIYYDGYEGDCAPRLKLRLREDNKWGNYGTFEGTSAYVTTAICPNSSAANQTCYMRIYCEYNGTNCTGGTYDLWAWSDDEITNVKAEYRRYVFIEDIATSANTSGGTCNSVACSSTGNNCNTDTISHSGYTDPMLLGPFEITPEMVSTGATYIRPGQSPSAGMCTSVPIYKAIDPTGQAVQGSEPFYYSRYYGGGGFYQDNNWHIKAWSETPVTRNVYYRAQQQNEIDPSFTHPGPFAPDCPDNANEGWTDLATYNLVNDNTERLYLQVDFNHTEYAGGCGTPKIRITTPPPSSEVISIDLAKTGVVNTYYKGGNPPRLDLVCRATAQANNCSVNYYYSTIYGGGPYLDEGEYIYEIWSDLPIAGEVYVREDRDFQIFSNRTIDGGTCYGEACVEDQAANCKSVRTNWIDEAGTNDISSFEIGDENHLIGMKIEVITSGYSGECDNNAPVYRVRDPSDNLITSGLGGTTCDDGFCETTISVSPPSRLETGDWAVEGWSDELIYSTVKWKLQRIDVAKRAAKNFLDNAQWKTGDRVGLVSFSNSADVEYVLKDIDEKDLIKGAMDNLEPDAFTNIADAISKAAGEFIGIEDGTGKFIILLTDGRANVCADGSNCGEAEAGQDAIDAANAARAENGADATVYVIGFADQGLIGDYEDTLRQIAKNKDEDVPANDYCDDEIHCGKYFYAANESELEILYGQIALEIAREIGEAYIDLPFDEEVTIEVGAIICGQYNTGISDFTSTVLCSDDSDKYIDWSSTKDKLIFEKQVIGGLAGEEWWAAEIIFKMPCTAQNCDITTVILPPSQSNVWESDNSDIIEWDSIIGEYPTICEGVGPPIKCHQKVPFKYSDLNFSFSSAEVVGGTSLKVSFEIDNNGYKNVTIGSLATDPNSLKISFYKNDFDNPINLSGAAILGSATIGDITSSGDDRMALDTGFGQNLSLGVPVNVCYKNIVKGTGTCTTAGNPNSSHWKINVNELSIPCPASGCNGTILAVLNENLQVEECPEEKPAEIICSSESDFRFYTIDYYVWETPVPSNCINQ